MKIIVNNLAIEYMNEGKGPIILFLHGWMDSLRTFDALTPFLSNSFRIVRLDLPGFGGSETPKEPWGVGEYTDFVKDFCNKVEISPKVLVGHSFGGRISIKGLSEGAFMPQKVILIMSAGLAKHQTMRSWAFKILSKVGWVVLFIFPVSIQNRFRRELYRRAGSDYLDAGLLKKTFLKVTREDLSQNARNIRIPTLLIWGEKDNSVPLSDGKRFAELISGSKLEIIAGAGHFVHQERPEAVAKLIKEFASQ